MLIVRTIAVVLLGFLAWANFANKRILRNAKDPDNHMKAGDGPAIAGLSLCWLGVARSPITSSKEANRSNRIVANKGKELGETTVKSGSKRKPN
jgi:hypothetical protein